ncbi:uncharacterized protein LOC123705213 isoform X3 [Colias croceus]|uniref:uncharacterized protein LOC119835639 isoform X3 n=1 Tax=Zerene cesonia TaxID=33412 RepID=UPI0018E58DD3|nr:uncharacterized protein LOC119835639 isoform X3 [Zerene cesonia]XP_045509862.1 uncharacterized protein LOC123705213 isoform X3 [Colias croceus]
MASADFRKDVMPVRPRSVYTAHSYNQEESNLSAFQDYSKFLEGGLGQAELVGATAWQPPWRAPLQRKAPFYPGDDIYHADTWRELEVTDVVGGAGYNASVTPHGTICLRLRDRVKVDMTIDGAVRVTNAKNNIILALSRSGAAAALIHPNGRVYHYGSRVEIQARHQQGNNNESRHGPSYVNEALSLLQAAQYWLTDDGIDNWIINNVRVSQTADGLVRIHRCSHKYQLRTSPSNGSASITSPFLHCTASLGQTQHLFVRRGERRMHFDGNSFIVRNAGHSAGFDDKNQLKVY